MSVIKVDYGSVEGGATYEHWDSSTAIAQNVWVDTGITIEDGIDYIISAYVPALTQYNYIYYTNSLDSITTHNGVEAKIENQTVWVRETGSSTARIIGVDVIKNITR